jgi:hypothetical protein
MQNPWQTAILNFIPPLSTSSLAFDMLSRCFIFFRHFFLSNSRDSQIGSQTPGDGTMGIPRTVEAVDTGWEQAVLLSPIVEHHEEDKFEEAQYDNDQPRFDSIESVEKQNPCAAIGNVGISHPSMGFLPRPSSVEGPPNKGFKFSTARQAPLNMSRSKDMPSMALSEPLIKHSAEHRRLHIRYSDYTQLTFIF